MLIVNNYWVRLVGQSNFAGLHTGFFRALSKHFSGKDGSAVTPPLSPEKNGPYTPMEIGEHLRHVYRIPNCHWRCADLAPSTS